MKTTWKTSTTVPALVVLACLSLHAMSAGTAEPADDAARFGALETAYSASLSADGKRLVFAGPRPGTSGTLAAVIDLEARSAKVVAVADGKPLNVNHCGWSAADRLVCRLYGITHSNSVLVGLSRTMALDMDGKNQIGLGQRDTVNQLNIRQFDGFIVDWMDGSSGSVLMARDNVPEMSTGAKTARLEEGMGVDRIDTRTGKATVVERPSRGITSYLSDGRGNIRLKTMADQDSDGLLRGIDRHFYRAAGSREWQPLGIDNGEGESIIPVAIDPGLDVAYVLQRLNGRQALYRIALDGSGRKELVFASKEVDIAEVVQVGRNGRVIGVTYTTDSQHTEYFDPIYRGIREVLARSLPTLPLLEIVGASADEQVLLVWAGSDVDPGRYLVYNRSKNTLLEAVLSRPALQGRTLSPMKPVSYMAADGTNIPGYLTLPPGVTVAKNLPAIVMPHGGPASRDTWGFDWLAQYFAQRGYAVLQPNFRGSAGYGDDWLLQNGFKSWRTAIGDVNDGGRWLVAQGIADASKLAIVGWSYGGYAALQASVLDPDLFKAVVAIAPVTDLALLKNQARAYTNWQVVADYVGNGPHIKEGSPAENVGRFKAPVLMFHGEQDLNVDILQSRRMDKALRGAGKRSELVTYADLEHGLRDGTVRADLLRRSDAFLRTQLGIGPAGN